MAKGHKFKMQQRP